MANYKEMLRRFFEEGINQGNEEVFAEVVGLNYVNHNMPAPEPGPAGLRQVIRMFKMGFPDMNVTVEDMIGEGERIATRGVMTGTHKGEFMGIPATGKSIKIEYIDVWRAENGLFVENWVQMDMGSMMQQLGVAPPQN